MALRSLSVFVGLAASVALAQERLPSPERELVAEGHRLYQQHCAACHGAAGEGAPNWQRPNAQGELPPPPHGPEGHTWRHADAVLHLMISEGWRDPFNETSRLTMPAYKGVLTHEEIEAVIGYLKTIWTPAQRLYQAKESRKPSKEPSR